VKRLRTYKGVITEEEAIITYHGPVSTEMTTEPTGFQRVLLIAAESVIDVWEYVDLRPSYRVVGDHLIKPLAEYKAEIKRGTVLDKISDLRYELLKPVRFEDVEIDEGIYYLLNNELGLFGSGNSLAEALRDCEADLIVLYEEYNSPEARLTEEAEKFKRLLNSFIRKK
jgi:hypothetical protein